jgi:hypothetical protein
MSELFGVEHYGGPLSEEVMSPLFVKIKLYDGTILEINDAAAQAVESACSKGQEIDDLLAAAKSVLAG